MHPAPTTLVLTRRVVEQTLAHFGLDSVMRRLVSRLEKTMMAHDAERTVTPTRSGFHYDTPHPGLVEWMPIHERGRDVTIKVVGYHPKNPEVYGLPTIVSTISAYDTATGHLSCIMDGVLPTAMRTAAASVIATRQFANPDSRTLGLIGCGAQAVAHVHALSLYYAFDRILIYDVDGQASGSLADRCRHFDTVADIELSTLPDILKSADILLTATSIDVGAGPLFDVLPHRPHLHVNAIGSDFPGKTELPLSLLQHAFVCPDFRPQAVLEGECQRLEDRYIGDDIVAVCKNPVAYHHLREELTVYDSTGWSLQDQVVLRLFAEMAAELSLGEYLEIENMSGDATNPYHFLSAEAEAIPVRTTATART
ncbi:ornithine cyclodeaminase [Neolewinella xylanilytica]|uniref:Ornithine cyclodeaminase n=1 Tax=Neolewinella xylanilytica TaxID=1514080 RepID=A0A2S6I2F3_9BACT|nr:ornithine cyclodeaminase family protein [Neolewinella xylanilytica]PPK85261.1 ornithine cyclodeaminase [Neolewinella xylanilytica]